jgi:hypothetical protein
MADNVTFLTKQINAYKTDIDHIKAMMSKTLDSAEEQKLRSEKIKYTNEMMNYIQLLDQFKAS